MWTRRNKYGQILPRSYPIQDISLPFLVALHLSHLTDADHSLNRLCGVDGDADGVGDVFDVDGRERQCVGNRLQGGCVESRAKSAKDSRWCGCTRGCLCVHTGGEVEESSEGCGQRAVMSMVDQT